MSWREIDRLRKDAVGFRALAKALLAYEDLNPWEVEFLEHMVRLTSLEEFSPRRSETLLDIRDGTISIKTVDGFSIETLLRGCYDARADLSDEDEQWIVAARERNPISIKRKNVWMLLRLSRQLGLIDEAA